MSAEAPTLRDLLAAAYRAGCRIERTWLHLGDSTRWAVICRGREIGWVLADHSIGDPDWYVSLETDAGSIFLRRTSVPAVAAALRLLGVDLGASC